MACCRPVLWPSTGRQETLRSSTQLTTHPSVFWERKLLSALVGAGGLRDWRGEGSAQGLDGTQESLQVPPRAKRPTSEEEGLLGG